MMKKEFVKLLQDGEVKQSRPFKDLDWQTKVDLLKEWRYELDRTYQMLIVARNVKEHT